MTTNNNMFCRIKKTKGPFNEMKKNALVEFLTKKKNSSFYATNFDDIAYSKSILDLYGAKLRFYDVQYLTSTAFVSATSQNRVNIDCNPVHYGVVYAYKYPNDISQLLFYDMHDIVCTNNQHTTSQTYNDIVNYVVNDII